MAVQYNVAYKINDEIRMQANPIFGVLSLSNFSDVIIGETEKRFFFKEFRFAKNEGLIFSEYLELNTSNLAQIQFENPITLWIEIKYTRKGTDNEGELQLNSVNFTGSFEPLPEGNHEITKLTEGFKETYYANHEHRILTRNLLKKLYGSGIVPKYVKRDFSDNPEISEKDFIQTMNMIAYFKAMIILKSRKFLGYYLDSEIMSEILRQENLFFPENYDLLQLSYLANNLKTQFALRGTNDIFRKKEGSPVPVDGELLRIINFSQKDEFNYALYANENAGWHLGRTSPLYRGNIRNIQLNKAYENTEQVNSLTAYPLINDSFVSIYDDAGTSVIRVSNPTINQFSGIRWDTGLSETHQIVIDNSIDYEISFFAKMDNPTESKLLFGLNAFDSAGNLVNTKDIQTGQDREICGEVALEANRWVFVRYHVYHNEMQYSNDFRITKTNLKSNTFNVKFSKFVNRIVPIIGLLRSTDANPANLYIKNLKIFPIWHGKTAKDAKEIHSFLGINNILKLYVKNNNTKQTEIEFDENLSRFLVPRGVTIFKTRLEDA